jgi:hypothetical protein
MNRIDILKILAKKTNAQSYLEIGVAYGDVFRNIGIQDKIGVDPDTNSAATLFMTSDEFFTKNNKTFDLIFIDGLHHSGQVEKDINNSLKVLNHTGYIVCHDMLPITEQMQLVPRIQEEWTGDCWKAWIKLRTTRNDLNMFVVDSDYGCGIIHAGNQDILKIDTELNYSNFCKNKKEWMNIVSLNEFITSMGI